jgi:hypothetical protein
MTRAVAVFAIALCVHPVLSDTQVAYSNTTSGPNGGYSSPCGLEFGDALEMTSGGIWDGVEFSFWNSPNSPSRLISARMVYTLYNWDGGEITYVAAWVVPTLVSNLDPGESGTFSQDGYYTQWGDMLPTWHLDSTVVATVKFDQCVWEGEPGELGQLLFDPPSVGSSDDEFAIWDEGWQWQSFGGDPVANFNWEIRVYRCNEPGAAGRFCNADLYPNNGDGEWNPLWTGDGDCIVNVSDLGVILPNFGTTSGATRETGDIYPDGGDGTVDIRDLGLLLSQYGDDCN